jgi:hypothetical protein
VSCSHGAFGRGGEGKITAAEAREVIQAQSADFGAYRQRLAGTTGPGRRRGARARQATGKVQARCTTASRRLRLRPTS